MPGDGAQGTGAAMSSYKTMPLQVIRGIAIFLLAFWELYCFRNLQCERAESNIEYTHKYVRHAISHLTRCFVLCVRCFVLVSIKMPFTHQTTKLSTI